MKQPSDQTTGREPIRKSVLIIIIVGALALVAGLVHFAQKPHELGADGAATSENPQPTASIDPVPANRSVAATSQGDDPQTPTPPTPNPIPKSASPVVAQPVLPEPSPYARQLVAGLVQLNLTNGPLTPEKLAAWQQSLQQLTNGGPAAVPAIREFLQSKMDSSFDSIGGAAVAGQASLRLSMLDALSKIGGPEATALSADTLRSTMDPREIALLARNLEQQAPGEYQGMALDAARAALAQAAAGKLAGTDVGALFGVLQQYGGATAVPELQDVTGKWTYYSAIALGGLADGAGIPALAQMAQDSSTGGSRVKSSAAMQMLAQLAPDSPQASAAFLEQARNGQVAPVTWIKIGALLGGEQLQIGTSADNGLPTGVRPVSTYSMKSSDQNFSTVSVLDSLTADQLKQRVQFIDQVLSGNPGAAATDALQKARNILQTRLQPQP